MKQLFYLFVGCIFFANCDFYRFVDIEPAYINIDHVELRAPSGQTISQGIKDLWIFKDDLYLGTFPIPSRIPLTDRLAGQIKIFPGIRHYGILARPEIYPLLNEFGLQVNLSPFDSIPVVPVFTYKNNLVSFLNEGFETGNSFTVDLDSFPSSSIERSQEKSREGLYAAKGHLSLASPVIEVSTSSMNVNEVTKRILYLELDILSEVDIQIGLSSTQNGVSIKNYFLTLVPTSDWKKIYIPVHEILADQTVNTFQLILKSRLPGSLNEANFFVDNLKLISLP